MPLFHHKPHDDPAFRAAKAEVEALVGRLGHDVTTLDDGGDPKNRQALADASERLNTAGAQLGEATDIAGLQVARQVALEGLHSTRIVRARLGLDTGPDPAAVPPPPPQPAPPAYGQQPGYGQPQPGYGPPPQRGGGLGGLIAAGLAGIVGGEILGDVLDGGDRDGGGWGDDGGGWGDDNGGGFDGGGW